MSSCLEKEKLFSTGPAGAALQGTLEKDIPCHRWCPKGLPALITNERIYWMPSLSCEEYRDSQRLLALKIRLSEKDLDPEERREIERLIEELEKRLNL